MIRWSPILRSWHGPPKSAEGVGTASGGFYSFRRKVESIAVGSDGAAQGVQLEDGTQLRSDVVLVNADPFVLQRLAGHAFSASFNEFVDGMKKDGTTLKVSHVITHAVGVWMSAAEVPSATL